MEDTDLLEAYSCSDKISQYNLAVCFRDGIDIEQNYHKAFKYFCLAADQGLALAQYNVATFYEEGMGGVLKDIDQAFKWYKLSAEQGLDISQYSLGMLYILNSKNLDDYIQANRWILLAANQGLDQAQYSLGMMYKLGLGVASDKNEAIKWFKMASNLENARLELELLSL